MAIARFGVALDRPDTDEPAGFDVPTTGWSIDVPEWLDTAVEGRRWPELLGDAGAGSDVRQIVDDTRPTSRCRARTDPGEVRVVLDPIGHPFCLVRAVES